LSLDRLVVDSNHQERCRSNGGDGGAAAVARWRCCPSNAGIGRRQRRYPEPRPSLAIDQQDSKDCGARSPGLKQRNRCGQESYSLAARLDQLSPILRVVAVHGRCERKLIRTVPLHRTQRQEGPAARRITQSTKRRGCGPRKNCEAPEIRLWWRRQLRPSHMFARKGWWLF